MYKEYSFLFFSGNQLVAFLVNNSSLMKMQNKWICVLILTKRFMSILFVHYQYITVMKIVFKDNFWWNNNFMWWYVLLVMTRERLKGLKSHIFSVCKQSANEQILQLLSPLEFPTISSTGKFSSNLKI